jgi:hypothetical protein
MTVAAATVKQHRDRTRKQRLAKCRGGTA